MWGYGLIRRPAGAIAATAFLAALLSGCASSDGAEGAARNEATTVPSPAEAADDSNPECLTVSTGTLAAVNSILVGEGTEVPVLGGSFDEASGFWFVIGEIVRPGSSGDDLLGIWATDTDITVDSFDGELLAVDGGSSQYSTAPTSTALTVDPAETLPGIHCLTQLAGELAK